MHGSDNIWMGLDVHKHTYHIALISGESKPVTWTAPAHPRQVIETLSTAGIQPRGACFEAGPTGFSLARALHDAGIPVIVAAPSKIPRSVSAGAKTDRLDCIKLAWFASKGLLKPIAIPSPQEESERGLMRRRHQILDSIRRTKQRIKALFLFHGMPEPAALKYWGKHSVEQLLEAPFSPDGLSVLDSHIRELTFYMEEKTLIETQVKEIMKRPEHKEAYEALRTIPGVGFVTASTFCLEIFNPERFNQADEIASYIGLAPTVHHSGLKTPRGRLVPVGQTRLRSLIIEAAWVWTRHDGKANELYRKLLGKSGIPQKAIAAVARRLAIIMWRLSIEQRAYT